MNRAERRRRKIAKRNDQLVQMFNGRQAVLKSTEHDTNTCPDCNADVETWVEEATRITHYVVRHDHTCPRLTIHLAL